MLYSAQLQRIAYSVQRIILGFLLFAICLFTLSVVEGLILPVPAHAQEITYEQMVAPYTNPDVPDNMHTRMQSIFIEMTAALVCQLTGIDPVNPNQQCLGVDATTGKIGFVENGGGAIGVMGTLIAGMYNPPIHMSDYVTHLASNFGVVKPVHAQGVGMASLNPFLNLWIAFRNIVYIMLVLIFVIIGLGIMLRVHIDPRTVMSIQNQIPDIIIAIVLITFSFAIAGLMVDLMWVSIYVVFNIFLQPDISGDNQLAFQEVQRQMVSNNPISVLDDLIGFWRIPAETGSSIGTLIYNWIVPGLNVQDANIIDLIFGGLKLLIGYVVGLFLGAVAGILAILVITIAILWALFRLWYTLLTAYIYFIFDVVFAPFWIVIGLLPGEPAIRFESWIKDMVANLVVFPAVIGLFLMAKVLMDQSTQPGLFLPPMVGGFGAGASDQIASLIALGMVLMAPQVLTMIRDGLKSPGFKYAAGVKQAIGTGPGLIQSGWTAYTSPYGALEAFKKAKTNSGFITSGLNVISGGVKGAIGRLTGAVPPPPAGGGAGGGGNP